MEVREETGFVSPRGVGKELPGSIVNEEVGVVSTGEGIPFEVDGGRDPS